MSPVDDERDTIINVTPHVEYLGNALYEFLPDLSMGTGEPQPASRLELTTVDVQAGKAKAFEAALSAGQTTLKGETLWYRMIAGGTAPRYVRLRPQPNLSAVLDAAGVQVLPDTVNGLISKTTVEILNLRPAMCYGVSIAHQ